VLEAVVPRLDPCDYDRLYFVFGLLRRLNPAGDDGHIRRCLSVIEILRGLQAVGVDASVVVQGEGGPAGQRATLPFHTLLSDPWSIIGPQVRQSHGCGSCVQPRGSCKPLHPFS
jgi:hypothetical protein